MWGFETLKDLLEVVIVPLTVFALGWMLPRAQELRRRQTFRKLIVKELGEASPDPKAATPGVPWHAHLQKRFIHESILKDVSQNRDFVLSLPADLAYSLNQMWTHFEKGRSAANLDESLTHGRRFRDYLNSACRAVDPRGTHELVPTVVNPWTQLIEMHEALPQKESPGAITSTTPPSLPRQSATV